jgi:hypothetical protein
MKTFYIQYNIGKAKYVVSFHDGIKKNKDNSDFFDIKLFRNKIKLNTFVRELQAQGYVAS